MTNSPARYRPASEELATWRSAVRNGTPDVLYPIGQGDLVRVEVGPKRVVLIGGAPGAGKTAFAMQAVIDALRITPSLRVCVCNVEMPPGVLLDRQLARLSGIDLTTIAKRRLRPEHEGRIELGLNTLAEVAGRLCFVRPPFDLDNIAATVDATNSDLIVLDYIQRIRPPGQHGDKRGSVDATMDHIRAFADGDRAVLVISAVARTKDKKGRSSYDPAGLSLASFRESSELEFGADDAFILTPPNDNNLATLKHLKARHAEPQDIVLEFDRSLQRFASRRGGAASNGGNINGNLAKLWERTAAAPESRE